VFKATRECFLMVQREILTGGERGGGERRKGEREKTRGIKF